MVKKAHGFTIVELLIVIVIIAILAAVTIVAYRGIQNRALASTLQSDLRNAATQLGLDNVKLGYYPATVSAANEGNGLDRSSSTSYQYLSDSTGFCITGTIENNPSISPYYISNTSGSVQEGTCPGHYGPFVESGGVVTTLAGSGVQGFADGTGSTAQFNDPRGIAVGPTGTIYVADANNNRIRAITPGGVVTTFAGTGATSILYAPGGLAVAQNGTVYVADSGYHRIRAISPAGVVTTFAGSTTSGYTDATGASARFYAPTDIAIGSNGTLYIADMMNRRIRAITTTGVVTTLAGSGSRASVDGTGTAASFGEPASIAIASDGMLYVADKFYHNIRKITPEGVVTTVAGTPSPNVSSSGGSYGYIDATGTAARFVSPQGIAVGRNGKLYIADTGNNRVRVITPAGVVSTLAGTTTGGFVDGTGSAALFNEPKSIEVLGDGTIYVGQEQNDSVRVVR